MISFALAHLHRYMLLRLLLPLILFGLIPGAFADSVDSPTKSLAVTFPAAVLDELVAGDLFSFALPAEDDAGQQSMLAVNAIVSGHDRYPDGDRVLYAHGADDSSSAGLQVVLTVGTTAVFAEITLQSQRWLFEALRQQGEVTGVIYQPAETAAHSSSQSSTPHTHNSQPVEQSVKPDFVIPALTTPDGLRRHTAPERRAQPLQLDSGDQSHAAASSSRAQTASTALQISQKFSQHAVFAGRSSEVEVTVQFHNPSTKALPHLSADIYFILEDTDLISAPACRRTLTTTAPRQHILRCDLPGGLAAGGNRSMSYRVRVPAKTAAMRVWSTIFSQSQRHDAYLNVVNDITQQATLDGSSKFNQSLIPQLTQDHLGNVVIDVLTLYSPDVEAMYGAATTTRINQMISVANQIYRDSGVAITLRPVHQSRVNYRSAGVDMYQQLDELTMGSHPAFRQVAALRQQYGADLVVLMRPIDTQSGLCGLANLGGYRTMGDMLSFNERDNAYSLVGIDCPVSSVLAHELGHNMGLTHSLVEDGEGGTFPFATGYGVQGQFATVMATPSRFGNASRIARFSDPQAKCQGMPCGVHYNDPQHGAHAALALNLVRFQVAAYMPTRVAMLPEHDVGTFEGADSDARIGVAASTDKGLSHVHTVMPGQKVDITADFYIDPEHVGRMGQFHVVADLGAAGLGVLQLDERGHTVDWDGTVADLVPFSAPVTLKATEYLRIISDFVPMAELYGHPLILFVAYQLVDSGELIYTLEPLVVNISH